jgi:hypothetical protein
VKAYRAKLVALVEKLDDAGRRTLLEYAEFLVSRVEAPATPTGTSARPPNETVLDALKRLNRDYPGLRKGALMQPVSELLSQHMMDARAAEEVIGELEALYARAHADRAGRA